MWKTRMFAGARQEFATDFMVAGPGVRRRCRLG